LVALRQGADWAVERWHDEPEQQSQVITLQHLGDKHVLALPLLGQHQHENLACALAALKLLAPALGIQGAALARGLSRADWPGRLQVIGRRPLSLLDGAHNPGGARVLATYVQGLQARRGPGRRAWVVGVLKDKDWRKMLRGWLPLADRFYVARPPDPRGLEAGVAVAWLRARGVDAVACDGLHRALAQARRWAGAGGLVVAAGSLYSAGALLKKRP